MFTGFRRQDSGFTIIEIFVTVLIIAILSAISVPIYWSYVESARASEAQAAIGMIANSIELYMQDKKVDPGSVDQLEELEYLTLDDEVSLKWMFSLIGQNPIVQIQARSTSMMRGGANKFIIYDVWTKEFSGYSFPPVARL